MLSTEARDTFGSNEALRILECVCASAPNANGDATKAGVHVVHSNMFASSVARPLQVTAATCGEPATYQSRTS